jgi:3-deoxy-D-manno-octulosonate 8-phosphate phosphatase (KDO 8-P phosphatase)
MQEIREIERRAARIRLLLMDCDGVLTDGRITLVGDGDEEKSFHTRDGHGIVLLHRAGLRSGIISGRTSTLVQRRARELGMAFVKQGTWDKIKEFEEVLSDIPLMQRSHLAVAVSDAVEETRRAAHYVTTLEGGFGAVREVCELILKSQGQWEDLMQRYIK